MRILMFLAAGDFSISIAERESDELFEKQKSFRWLVANHTGQVIDEFANSERLGAALATAIANRHLRTCGPAEARLKPG